MKVTYFFSDNCNYEIINERIISNIQQQGFYVDEKDFNRIVFYKKIEMKGCNKFEYQLRSNFEINYGIIAITRNLRKSKITLIMKNSGVVFSFLLILIASLMFSLIVNFMAIIYTSIIIIFSIYLIFYFSYKSFLKSIIEGINCSR